MESTKVYCICGEPYDEQKFMIECDNCREWYHGSCVGVYEYVSYDLDKYHCPRCEVTCGPSVFKKQNNLHRHNYTDTDAKNKPVQTGTPVFIEELKTRHFPSAEPIITIMKGNQLTKEYLSQNGFDQPILIEEKEGLDMRVPSEFFTVQDVEALVGSDRMVDVIDVARQTDIRMRVCDFVKYFNNPNRQRVLNLISLELSSTKLSELVEAPRVTRDLDWVNTVWPLIGNLPMGYKRPEVQKYCLVGVKDSYTDFHVDFGGTSVWYHVVRGEKVFYLIKPTIADISLYQRWMTSTSQSETFFGDQVDNCYRCILQAGHTMLIPTGWIHAVLTPVDTLVFGGNFLHSLNIPLQLQIYEIEKKTRTPERLRYPAFETINWYAGQRLCEDLKTINAEASKVPTYKLLGVKALLYTLKQWSQDRNAHKSRKEDIPSVIDAPKLLKDLSKEIRLAERFINSINPPKPERESKRKKKKPINKDFVDYSHPRNSTLIDTIKTEPKEPIKLNLKTLSKKMKSEPTSRPPLKLTLPKPAMYPYTTPLSENKQIKEDTNEHTSEENKCWFVAMDMSSDQKIKSANVGLKVKLTKQGDLPYVAVQSSVSTQQPFHSSFLDKKPQIQSIYDFHDDNEFADSDDDNCLTIDESSVKRKPSKGSRAIQSQDSIWAHANYSNLQLNNLLLNLNNITPEDLNLIDENSELPTNGIDELIKASAYTRDGSSKVEAVVSGRTSPSTREAIAGMLSISTTVLSGSGESGSSQSSNSSLSKTKKQRPQVEDVEDIDKVHQDDDFIYPSLDLSDDEDDDICARGSKGMVDEAWNPKARVGHVLPRKDRPCREGTKKQSVEKGLEAAAAKRAGQPLSKRPYHKKKPKLLQISPDQPSTSASTLNSSDQTASVSQTIIDIRNRKPKKGMATAKQRLGKILKLHKLYH